MKVLFLSPSMPPSLCPSVLPSFPYYFYSAEMAREPLNAWLFFHGFWGWSSEPRACMASALPSELSLQPLLAFLYWDSIHVLRFVISSLPPFLPRFSSTPNPFTLFRDKFHGFKCFLPFVSVTVPNSRASQSCPWQSAPLADDSPFLCSSPWQPVVCVP